MVTEAYVQDCKIFWCRLVSNITNYPLVLNRMAIHSTFAIDMGYWPFIRHAKGSALLIIVIVERNERNCLLLLVSVPRSHRKEDFCLLFFLESQNDQSDVRVALIAKFILDPYWFPLVRTSLGRLIV